MDCLVKLCLNAISLDYCELYALANKYKLLDNVLVQQKLDELIKQVMPEEDDLLLCDVLMLFEYNNC